MTSPIAAACYADRAVQLATRVEENVRIARDTYRLRVMAPEIASNITPGQFVMVRLDRGDDPLLGRPFALYDVVRDAAGAAIGIDVVYLVLGRMTSKLAKAQPGDAISIWGPLGNGFAPKSCEHLVMVAGGIGQTPMLALGAEALGMRSYGADRPTRWAERVTFCYGVRNVEYAAGIPDFEAIGIDVRLTTDDGSSGRQGLVTDTLGEILAEPNPGRRVVVCGPERMMEAVAKLTGEHRQPCEVSLETPMACGIGICFSCVAKVRQVDGEWDYKRTCVDGPVFDAEKIVWH